MDLRDRCGPMQVYTQIYRIDFLTCNVTETCFLGHSNKHNTLEKAGKRKKDLMIKFIYAIIIYMQEILLYPSCGISMCFFIRHLALHRTGDVSKVQEKCAACMHSPSVIML